MNIITYDLPEHWAAAFINGDLSGYETDDLEAIRLFTAEMVSEFGGCRCLSIDDDDSGNFRKYHDARHLGVLACNVTTFHFDIDCGNHGKPKNGR